ncbi:MAG: hypothetical protein RR338_01290, partial [Clostridia bacterium]
LEKALKIANPTAIKTLSAFMCLGALGEKSFLHGYKFDISDDILVALKSQRGYHSNYKMLVENPSQFKAVGGVKGYVYGTLLPVIKIGLTFGGSLSIGYIERKFGVNYQRATEVFDILYALNYIGGVDERNPARNLMAITACGYDELVFRLEARVW